MSAKICIRFGVVSGAAVGLLINFLTAPPCCSPAPLTVAQCAAYGVFVGLIAVLLAAAFACLVNRLPVPPVIGLATMIGVVTGALLGPLAYTLPHPMVAMLVCAVAGAILGWLVCRLLCGAGRPRWEAAR